MPPARILSLFLVAVASCHGWHVPGHERVTRAALLSLPADIQARWKSEELRIVTQYSLLPDTYRGRQVDRAEFQAYCLKPDGKPIHNVQWKRAEDLESLSWSMNGIIRALRSNDLDAAARHAGVLAHFLSDSTCPAHAFMPADSPLANLRDLLPPPDHKKGIDLHTEIERSTPEFDLAGRAPALAGVTVADAAESLLSRCYAAIKANRANMIDLVNAVYISDAPVIDRIRHQAARTGAELVADAYYTAFVLAARQER